MAASKKEAARFLQIFKNVCLMLEARDFYPAHDWGGATLDDFIERVGPSAEDAEGYVLEATKIGQPRYKVCVFFPQDRINKAALMALREQAQLRGCSEIILCGRADLTGATRQLVRADPDFSIQFFMDWKFLVNLPDHDMVPQHVVLTDVEKAALLKRYKVQEMQLPRMHLDDPMAKYYNMKRGQVVKIIREGGVNGRHVTYRIVN